jgi:hypothetical protein
VMDGLGSYTGGNDLAEIFVSTVVGGTASAIVGGKFVNGAASAASFCESRTV